MSRKNIIGIILCVLLYFVILFITISVLKKPYLGILLCAIVPVLLLPLFKKEKNKN